MPFMALYIIMAFVLFLAISNQIVLNIYVKVIYDRYYVNKSRMEIQTDRWQYSNTIELNK